MRKFSFRKLRNTLNNDGVMLNQTFHVYVNNDDVRSFTTQPEVVKYLQEYVKFNEIFRFEIYKSTLQQL